MLKKYNSTRVLELFFRHPTRKFGIREISRTIRISPPRVSTLVNTLVKEGYLVREKTRVLDYVSANADADAFKRKKMLCNIEMLYESGFIKALLELSPEAIVVFGSYARGEDIEKSDIDIALIGTKDDIDASRFEKKLERSISIHHIELKSAPKELKNSIANGVVLEGYLKIL